MQRDLAAGYILKRLKDELSPDLTYHNDVHTMDVHSAAQHLAQAEGISGRPLELLLTAALFHDAGFLITAKGHEVSSCTIAQEALPAFGYTEADIELICRLIMATEVPQRPQEHLEEVLCDADLDYLGRGDFFVRSELLYNEMQRLGTVRSRAEYDGIQLAFLENHRYFTATAKRLRDRQKAENFKKLIV
ncbi:HD domain-containing protein [Parapedobacter sp. DT-150]|uniref:HD domain-containing protein n=1 Tax=Parapedobacter sp. DT-150 TaxID=3396162 RepID=UPI003F1C2D79